MLENQQEFLLHHGIEILDCHTHMGPYGAFHIPRHSAQGLVQMMDLTGTKCIVSSAHLAITSDYEQGNEIVLQACRDFPERIYAYACASPHYPQQVIPALERAFAEPNTLGIKIHGALHQAAIDAPAYDIVYDYANQKGTIVLIHTWGIADVMQAERVVKRFPKATFILGHGGADVPGVRYALEMCKTYANVYIDTAISQVYEDNLAYCVTHTDSSKILYGSDMPFYDPRMTLGRILLADISLQDKRKILGENFAQIANLPR